MLTLEESAELVIVMQSIADWLRECQDAGETSISFQELVMTAEQQAIIARDRFFDLYQRYPALDDVPESLMRIPQARSIKRLADRTKTMLPPAQS